MPRCPVCNAKLAGATSCRRCGCDLSLTEQARRQARQALSRALQAWRNNQTEDAHAWLKQALMWDSSELTIKVASFIKTRLSLS